MKRWVLQPTFFKLIFVTYCNNPDYSPERNQPVFRANFEGCSDIYAVEIAKSN